MVVEQSVLCENTHPMTYETSHLITKPAASQTKPNKLNNLESNAKTGSELFFNGCSDGIQSSPAMVCSSFTIAENNSDETLYKIASQNHPVLLSSSMSKLAIIDGYQDVMILCERQSLAAHRIVLSAASSFLKTIFQSLTSDGVLCLTIEGVKWSTLCHIMQYIYVGQTYIQKQDMVDFIAAGQSLGICGLKDLHEYLLDAQQVSAAESSLTCEPVQTESELVSNAVNSPSDADMANSSEDKSDKASIIGALNDAPLQFQTRKELASPSDESNRATSPEKRVAKTQAESSRSSCGTQLASSTEIMPKKIDESIFVDVPAVVEADKNRMLPKYPIDTQFSNEPPRKMFKSSAEDRLYDRYTGTEAQSENKHDKTSHYSSTEPGENELSMSVKANVSSSISSNINFAESSLLLRDTALQIGNIKCDPLKVSLDCQEATSNGVIPAATPSLDPVRSHSFTTEPWCLRPSISFPSENISDASGLKLNEAPLSMLPDNSDAKMLRPINGTAPLSILPPLPARNQLSLENEHFIPNLAGNTLFSAKNIFSRPISKHVISDALYPEKFNPHCEGSNQNQNNGFSNHGAQISRLLSSLAAQSLANQQAAQEIERSDISNSINQQDNTIVNRDLQHKAVDGATTIPMGNHDSSKKNLAHFNGISSIQRHIAHGLDRFDDSGTVNTGGMAPGKPVSEGRASAQGHKFATQEEIDAVLDQYQRKLAFHEPRPCPSCDRMYRDAATLRTHLGIMHTPGSEPYQCSCGAQFRTKYEMYHHKKNGHYLTPTLQ
ncbi:uncharacterized protein LOC108676924 [Hyalella azteca]|uniref:Uncharacterized protein LOC108676924 n=1 Tax=Hyalella azteca TaxID=294128 RepID=A0A8B7P3N9_HYAAZ|nr:uncharacterized protein LOC108676924 [Hyalella azteca]XP_047739441.1 uncharacterized protein LOC108676924 [Hyalella azteca]